MHPRKYLYKLLALPRYSVRLDDKERQICVFKDDYGSFYDYQEISNLVEEMQSQINQSMKENRKLKCMIDEGLGWEDMQQDSAQSHIN
jgi:hypothetical protein